MWRSVFLHEFRDEHISNYQALRGAATPSSLTLTPIADRSAGGHAVAIAPGTAFEHVLAQPLQQVIGISCRVRLAYADPQAYQFSVVRLGNSANMLFRADPDPSTPGGTLAAAYVFVDNPWYLGDVVLRSGTYTDFRFDWHTSGQARVFADGRLVGYHNAVAPGAALTVDRVVFGMPGAQPVSSRPMYRLSRVFVRALSYADSLAGFSRLLPQVTVREDMNRCRERALRNLLRVLATLRQFMASVHQALSQPWSQRTGPPSGPFRPEATRAHALATASVVELVGMLRTDDFSAPDRFLEPFTEFLRILHATLPEQFEALAAELVPMEIVPDDCKDALDGLSDANKDAFAPIIDLLTSATERVRQIAEGQ